MRINAKVVIIACHTRGHAFQKKNIIDNWVRLITFVHREFNEIAVLISILVIVILFENYSKKVFEFSRQKI